MEMRSRLGLDWTRATVALLEGGLSGPRPEPAGRRDISLEEFLLLEATFGRTELLAANPGDDITLGRFEISNRIEPGQKTSEWNRSFIRDARRAIQLEGGGWFDPIDPAAHAESEANQRAANRLGISALDLAKLARKRWGHGLTEERERRAAERGVDPDNRGQRAHITRELIRELFPAGETQNKRGKTK